MGDGQELLRVDSDTEDPRDTKAVASTLRARRVLLGASALLLCTAAALVTGLGRVVSHAAAATSSGGGLGGFLGASESEGPPCLCVFDIDRTLTAKQGWAGQCPTAEEKQGMPDYAYAKGTLVLSEIGSKGIGSTFCAKCNTGIVTAGVASGDNSAERRMVLHAIGETNKTFSDWWQDVKFNPNAAVQTSLVLEAVDGKKQESVRSMVNWWKSKHQLDIADANVWFFDDIHDNVQAFEGTGFNAIQVSCDSRGPAEAGGWDGKVGGCGGQLHEVVKKTGIHTC
jgi:hypothetical protein